MQGAGDTNCSLVHPSKEEDDLLRRNSKKIKNTEGINDLVVSSGAWPLLGTSTAGYKKGGVTFADKLKGRTGDGGSSEDEEEGRQAVGGIDAMSDDDLEFEDDAPIRKGDKDQCMLNLHEEMRSSPDSGKVQPELVISDHQDQWRVVQKPRRSRKQKDEKEGLPRSDVGGSRFGVLAQAEDIRRSESNNVVAPKKAFEDQGDVMQGQQQGIVVVFDQKCWKKGNNGKRVDKVQGLVSTGLQEKEGINGVGLSLGVDRVDKDEDASGVGLGANLGHEPTNGPAFVVDSHIGQPLVDPLVDPKDMMELQPSLLDPGEVGKLEGLSGKFWDGPTQLDPDQEMMEDGQQIFFWNIQGACDKSLRRNLRLVWGKSVPDLLVLAETKCQNSSQFRCFESLGFDGLAVVPSVGRSGGLVATWRSNRVGVSVIRLERQYLHLRISLPGRPVFFFTVVYAVPSSFSKQVLWADLSSLADSISSPWVVAGDFNDIMLACERTGGSQICYSRLNKFQERVRGCRLCDLGFQGPRFTWRGCASVG
ncbi:hypothetical protein K1719_047529 [Acacia pycnantha]|nr:hypothetical protein K1719_047529 [Acacia pycnantha]